jgi:hypothetical protein
MSSLFVALLAFAASTFRTRAALQAEILALRHPLAVFQKNAPSRLRWQRSDRLLWVLLSRWWPGWLRSLHIVRPDTAFPQLTVGSNGDVWATDTSDSFVYKYDDGLQGFLGFGCCVTQIQAGDGVWILDGSNIYRWEPSALKFGQVGGSFVSVSVGSGGGVWGIDSSHQVFAFSTP